MPTASAPTNSPPEREAEERPCQAGEPTLHTSSHSPASTLHCLQHPDSSAPGRLLRCTSRDTECIGRGKGKFCSHSPANRPLLLGKRADEGKLRRARRVVVVSVFRGLAEPHNVLLLLFLNVEQGSHRLTVALFVPAQSGAGNVRMRTGRRKLKGRTGRCGPETGHDAGKTGTRGQKLSWRYPGRARGDAQGAAAAGRRALLRDDWRAHGGGVGWLMARRGGLHCVRNFCQVVSSGWGAGGAGPVRHWGL